MRNGGNRAVARSRLVTPVVADHLKEGLRVAERERHVALLVEMDTPGGLGAGPPKRCRTPPPPHRPSERSVLQKDPPKDSGGRYELPDGRPARPR